jgi:hypothetical protein
MIRDPLRAASLVRSLGVPLRLMSVHERLPMVTVPAGAGLPVESVNTTLHQELARDLLGSVSSALVRTSHCPVVVVPRSSA